MVINIVDDDDARGRWVPLKCVHVHIRGSRSNDVYRALIALMLDVVRPFVRPSVNTNVVLFEDKWLCCRREAARCSVSVSFNSTLRGAQSSVVSYLGFRTVKNDSTKYMTVYSSVLKLTNFRHH